MSSLRRMTTFWDDHIGGWLDGDNDISEPLDKCKLLDKWYGSYAGKGHGKVTLAGMPEPWIGDLTSPDRARLVILGLNPGHYIEDLQARKSLDSKEGLYAEQVRKLGSYTKWAATNPYLIDPWKGKKDLEKKVFGINRYHATRQSFARRWLEDPNLPESAVVLLELYPWHSTGITGPMRPDPELIRHFVWEPIDELTNVRDIFAFGKPWVSQLEKLGMKPDFILGKGGDDYGSSVASRSVHVYNISVCKRIIVSWHTGSAGPPSAKETALLKKALD